MKPRRRSFGWRFAAAALAAFVAPGSVGALTIVLVTENNGSLTSEESARRTTFQSWGHTVNTLWDGASQATYDAALAAADVAYVSEESSSTDIAYKLRSTSIGVMWEEPLLDDEMGAATSDGTTENVTQINLVDPAYGSGLVTIFSSTQQAIYLQGTVAAGFHAVANTPAGQKALGSIEAGSTLANAYSGSNVAAGRRVRLPWGGGSFAWSSLNSTGLFLVQNAIVWAGAKPLLLHWKLDESSGTSAADASTYARTGALAGSGTWVNAVRHRGLSATGAGKVEVTNLLANPTSFSLAAWANITAHDSSGTDILSVGDYLILRASGSTVTTGFYTGSTWVTINYTTTLAGSGWRHLATTFDEETDTLRLYLDGVQVASTTTASKASYSGLGTKTVAGAHGNGSTAYDLNGTIDDVRVYNKALTAAEVRWLFGFTAHLKLDETSGTVAADSSPAGNTGSYSGSNVLGKAGVYDYAVGIGGGSADLISLPRDALHTASSVTATFWLKTTATGVQSVVSAANSSQDNDFQIRFDNNTTLRVYFHGASVAFAIASAADGKWHHYAVTALGETTTTTLYRDGAVVSSASAGPGGTPLSVDAGGLILGQDQDSVGGGYDPSQRLIGDLDDFRLYNRALSAAEIADLYGLLIHWKLDETAGTTIADSSPCGRHAAFANGAPTWVAAIRGAGLSFNGTTDDAVSNANFTPPTEGTVAFWFKSAGPPASRQRFFGLGGDWEMWQDPDGVIRCDVCTDGEVGGFKTASSYAVSGSWYHLAAVFDSDTEAYTVYINGQVEKTGISTSNLVQQAAAKLSLGTRTGTTERFTGVIDDFRVYNRKLSHAEVYEVFGLVGWYKLDELSGTVAADSTGLGHDGTYGGSPTLGVSANGAPAQGTAVALNGANYISVPGLFDQPSDLSVAGWVKLDGRDTNGADFVSFGDCFLLRFAGWGQYITANYRTASSSVTLDVPKFVEDTGWRHVAIVLRGGDTLKLYVDGVEAGSTAATSPISYAGYGANTQFGRHGNGGTVHDLVGRLDDLRVYDRAMQPDEVYQLYRGSRISGLKILSWTEAR